MPIQQKAYPNLEEAEKLLQDMPSHSLKDRRARAVFASAFLGALRADTIASLRVEHIDIAQRRIIQDTKISRSKAGKSIVVSWFPIPRPFEEEVISWLNELRRLNFQNGDAAIPAEKRLKLRSPVGPRIPVPTTTQIVTDAFKCACQNSPKSYTPHAARHTISAARDERQLTQMQRKAWSTNMGHTTEQTTDQWYGNIPDEKRIEIMQDIVETTADSIEVAGILADVIEYIEGRFKKLS
ncbi:site-specific integrase [Sulfitobacter sp. S190]|uniref:site-specific integrase n=1 Tax=Sulfitobacter sp. S190 TaxID=2867022 RepID=UPI0021A51103|nr:site-specific integrase [Sulfitobacter sp. S190]UWR21287.1 site-specific integrase [Sulfitobacter sp. S190]